MQSHIYPTAPTSTAADTLGVPASVANHEHEEQIHSPGKGKGVLSKVKSKARKLKDKIKKVTHSGNTHDDQQHEDDREFEEADLRRQLGDGYINDGDEEEEEEEEEEENNHAHALDHRDYPSDQTTRVEQLRGMGDLRNQKQPAKDSDVEVHGGRDVLSYNLLPERPEYGGNVEVLNIPLRERPEDFPVIANESSAQDTVRDGIPMTPFRNPGPPGTAQAVPTQYRSYGTTLDPPISLVDTGYVSEGPTDEGDDKKPMLPEELFSAYPSSQKAANYNSNPAIGVPVGHRTLPGTPPLDLEGGNLHGNSGGLAGPDTVYPDDLIKPNPAFGTASPISDKIGLLNDESDGTGQRRSGELSGTLDKPVPEHVSVDYEASSAHQTPELHDSPNYNEKDKLDTPVLDTQEDKLFYRPISGPGDLREEPLEESIPCVNRDDEDLPGYASPMPSPASEEGLTENILNDPGRKEAALSAAVGGQVKPAHDEADVPTSREGNEKSWGDWTADKVTAAKDTVASEVGLGGDDGANLDKHTHVADLPGYASPMPSPAAEEGLTENILNDPGRKEAALSAAVGGQVKPAHDEADVPTSREGNEKSWGDWTADKVTAAKDTVASEVGLGGDDGANLDKHTHVADLPGYASPMPSPAAEEGLTENILNDPGRKEAALSAAVGGQVKPAHDEADVPTSREGNEKSWGDWTADKVTAAKDTVASEVGLGGDDGANLDKHTHVAEDNVVDSGIPVEEEGITSPPQADWPRDERTWGQWTGDKMNDAKNTVAPTVGFGGGRKVEEENPAPLDKNINASTEGLGDDENRQESVFKDGGIPVVKRQTDFTPEVDRGTSTVEAHYTTPGSDNLGDDKDWGQWTADKISNVKDTVASTAGVGGSEPEIGEGRISTPVEETRNTISEGGRPGDESSLGQWTADNVNKAKNTIASTVGLAGSESRPEDTVGLAESESTQERVSTPEVDRGTPTVEAHYTSDDLADEKSWGQWTVDKISNVKDTVASTVGIGGSKPEMGEGRISTRVEETRNTISEGGRPGGERGLGQWTADNVNKAKNTIASTVRLAGSESRPEEGSHVADVPESKNVVGDTANLAAREGDRTGLGQRAADKVGDVKDSVVSTVGLPAANNEHVISESQELDINRDADRDILPQTASGGYLDRGLALLPEGGVATSVSPTMEDEQREKESWGKWAADKVNNAKLDAVASTVVLGTSRPTTAEEEEEEVPAVIASENLSNDGIKERTMSLASDENYYDPNTLENNNVDVIGIFSNSRDDSQEAPSLKEYATGRLLGLKDAVASKIGYAAFAAEPTDGNASHADSVVSPASNRVAEEGINEGEGGVNGTGFTQKLLNTAVASRNFVASKVGYATSTKDTETGEAEDTEKELSPIEEDLQPGSSTDGTMVDKNQRGEEGKSKNSQSANHKQKVLDAATAATRDYLAASVGSGNGKKNAENASTHGEGSTTVLTGQQPGNVDEKRETIASRLSPGEEDKALSQLITEKMSSTAVALKQKLMSPRSARSSAGAEAQH